MAAAAVKMPERKSRREVPRCGVRDIQWFFMAANRVNRMAGRLQVWRR